jgi:hypothetical protein
MKTITNFLFRKIPDNNCILKLNYIVNTGEKTAYSMYRIWGFHSGGYEEYHFMGYDAV